MARAHDGRSKSGRSAAAVLSVTLASRRDENPAVAIECGSAGVCMFILGVSCYYHDSAAVLLKDGQLIAAAEEERFSRVKHDNGYPKHAIEFCLKQARHHGERPRLRGLLRKAAGEVRAHLDDHAGRLSPDLSGFPRIDGGVVQREVVGQEQAARRAWISIRRRSCLSSITSRTRPAPCLPRRLKKPPC